MISTAFEKHKRNNVNDSCFSWRENSLKNWFKCSSDTLPLSQLSFTYCFYLAEIVVIVSLEISSIPSNPKKTNSFECIKWSSIYFFFTFVPLHQKKLKVTANKKLKSLQSFVPKFINFLFYYYTKNTNSLEIHKRILQFRHGQCIIYVSSKVLFFLYSPQL